MSNAYTNEFIIVLRSDMYRKKHNGDTKMEMSIMRAIICLTTTQRKVLFDCIDIRTLKNLKKTEMKQAIMPTTVCRTHKQNNLLLRCVVICSAKSVRSRKKNGDDN